MRGFYKTVPISVFCFASALSFSVFAAKEEIPVLVKCQSLTPHKTNIVPNATLYLVLNERKLSGLVQTNASGYVHFAQVLLNETFKFYGYINDNIIPGCATWFSPHINPDCEVTLRGLDCGGVKGCDEPT